MKYCFFLKSVKYRTFKLGKDYYLLLTYPIFADIGLIKKLELVFERNERVKFIRHKRTVLKVQPAFTFFCTFNQFYLKFNFYLIFPFILTKQYELQKRSYSTIRVYFYLQLFITSVITLSAQFLPTLSTTITKFVKNIFNFLI